MMEIATQTKWVVALEAWRRFTQIYPQLGYGSGYWILTNFLRYNREHLIAADVIRKARGRFWLADISRFPDVAFELATGKHVRKERV